MTARPPTLVAVLSMAGLLGWMATKVPVETPPLAAAAAMGLEGLLQERSGGSEVPCAVPLAWRIARVDPKFDLTPPEATAVVQEAARVWENGTGRRLFTHDPEGGFPIRLVYDERQESLVERERRSSAIDDLGSRLDVEREGLLARSRVQAAAAARHAGRVADLERRVSEHNASVRRWNELANVPDSSRIALASAGEALQREQDELAARRSVLEAQQASLVEAEEQLNGRIREHTQLMEQLAAEFPPSTVEAGEYREAVTRVGGRVDSVSREIRLYRFASVAELRLIAAHELGHALGLGHTGDPAGVMHETSSVEQPVARLASSDVTLFTSVCPVG